MPTLPTWVPVANIAKLDVAAVIKIAAPVWLNYISEKLMIAAKTVQPRFGNKQRRFWIEPQPGSDAATEYSSHVYCEGPFVETTAWDYTFDVPSGGFKFGDIDPLTGQPFPGGRGKGNRTYILLENKEVLEGETAKKVARTYSQHKGEKINQEGFFSKAIRQEIGSDTILSPAGANNLQTLGMLIGQNLAMMVGRNIQAQGTAYGYKVSVSGLTYL